MTEHNDSTDAFPDIEIYVKRVELDAVTAWLSQYFDCLLYTSDAADE